jgi:heme exporter protein B
MASFLRKIWTIFEKDFLTQRRTKESFSAMLVFGVLVLVIFNFTMDPGSEQILITGAGILWVAFTFAGTLGLNRAFAPESENGNFQALMLLPIDKGAIYLGKLLSGFVFMFFVELFILPLFVLFFNLNIIQEIPSLLLICILGTLGFVGIGTIFSAVALNTKMREVMLPVLLFPVAIPAILSSVEATGIVLRGEGISQAFDWLKILIAFDVIVIVTSFLTFEYVLEE